MVDEFQHELFRGAMRLVEIDDPLEIAVISDVPAATGLGSRGWIMPARGLRSGCLGLQGRDHARRQRTLSP